MSSSSPTQSAEPTTCRSKATATATTASSQSVGGTARRRGGTMTRRQLALLTDEERAERDAALLAAGAAIASRSNGRSLSVATSTTATATATASAAKPPAKTKAKSAAGVPAAKSNQESRRRQRQSSPDVVVREAPAPRHDHDDEHREQVEPDLGAAMSGALGRSSRLTTAFKSLAVQTTSRIDSSSPHVCSVRNAFAQLGRERLQQWAQFCGNSVSPVVVDVAAAQVNENAGIAPVDMASSDFATIETFRCLMAVNNS